jgi:hypothetical protein
MSFTVTTSATLYRGLAMDSVEAGSVRADHVLAGVGADDFERAVLAARDDLPRLQQPLQFLDAAI